MQLGWLKRFSISAGLYRPVRRLHRAVFRSQSVKFQADVNFYSQFVGPGDLCFDIGANIGANSEALLALGATVVSAEPQPDLAREVVARCSHYREKSIVLQIAVGDSPGELTLHLRESTGQASLISDWQGMPKGAIRVQVTTLDKLIAQYGSPKFCKIDVEGYEPNVLKGLSTKIPTVTFEYHVDDRGAAQLRECLSLLGRHGPFKINATPEDGNSLLFHDWLDSDEFLSQFPECVRPNHYGDIVVR